MSLLAKLVLLPLAPVQGVIWVAEQLEDQAYQQYFSPEAIRRQLAELQAQLEAGDITEEEYELAENELLDRLDEDLRFESQLEGEMR